MTIFDNPKFWMTVAQGVVNESANGERIIEFDDHKLHVDVHFIQKSSVYGLGKIRYDFYIPKMFLFRFWVLDISHYPQSSEQYREAIDLQVWQRTYRVRLKFQRKRIKIFAKYKYKDIEDMLMMLRLHYG